MAHDFYDIFLSLEPKGPKVGDAMAPRKQPAKTTTPKAAPKPESQAKRRKKAASNKDELPVLSEAEKTKYKNQWSSMLAT